MDLQVSTFASSLLGLILLLALWSWFKKESKSEKWKPANGGFGQYVEEPAVPDFCAPEELESCSIECGDCKQVPRYLKIDREKSLPGTVKPYRRHIVFCGGQQQWPSKFGKEPTSIVFAFNQLVKQRSSPEEISYRVMVTMCDEEPSVRSSESVSDHKSEAESQAVGKETDEQAIDAPNTSSKEQEVVASTSSDAVPSDTSPESYDVLVFPDGVRYFGVTRSNLPDLVEDQLVREQACTNIAHEILPSSRHWIFVCTHKRRDKRCGVVGQLVIEQLRKAIAVAGLEDCVRIAGTSHTGGHKFAGNVLVYPSGDWYGRVTPEEVPRLVHSHFLKKKVYAKLWRGRYNLTKQKQVSCIPEW